MNKTTQNLLDKKKIKWNDFYFSLQNQLLTYNSIKLSVTSLFEERLKMCNPDQYLTIIFKIQMENENIRSISLNQTIQLKEYSKLYSLFTEYWDIRSEDYHVTKIHSIIFTYAIFPLERLTQSKLTRASQILRAGGKSNKRFKFSGFNLPMTMDITQWGKIEYFDDNKQAVVAKFNSTAFYHVFLFDQYITVSLKVNDITLISWKDIMKNKNDLSSFTRIINKNHEYIFEKGKVIIKKIKRKGSFLKPIKFSLYRSEKFITMDLETKTIFKNNKKVFIPICISLYDGKNKITNHISNFKDKDIMLEESIQFLMRRKYSGYKVYFHNFTYFDGVFLMRSISKLANEVRVIMRNGRIIELRFKFGNKKVLYFRDSFLLLPASLNKLAINFHVENKSIFPYKFLNEQKGANIGMNYIGPVPSFSYFSKINKEQYDEYCVLLKEKDWNMTEELKKYCEQDVTTLHQVITAFSKSIYNLFRIDIMKYPTLPSLAFAIYRSTFLKDHKIPLIHGEMYENIKEGYTGGAVDVYRPYGKKIYRYDVNSLYPSVMKNKMMPVGTPVYFEGDIFKIDKDAFGFFNVKVETPTNMNIPILQCKVKTEKGGIRTIAGLGSWESTYFSEEIKKAMRKGYKFQVMSGYLFEKGNIFNEYVDFLFSMKVNSEKGSPNYIISKLLLNSLYGRLGMSPEMENTIIINESDSFEFSQENLVSNIIDLQNGKILMTYIDELEKFNTRTLNISVPVSAAVTAYARMHMADFKLMKGVQIYYSDTDSIDINKPLPSKYVGKELGKMKLEHIFDKVVYIAPKVYGGLSSGQEYVKIKGLKNPVSFDELTSLLEKDKKLSVYQEKWYRDMSQGEISIKDEVYTIMVTENKRLLIYDNKNKLIGSKPLLLKNGNIIKKENKNQQ